MNIFEINNINKLYKNFYLKIDDFTVAKGDIVGLVGENGSGKTTMLNIILGLTGYRGNYVKVDNVQLSGLGQLNHNVGIVTGESIGLDRYSIKEIKKLMKILYSEWNNNYFETYIKKYKLPEEKKVKNFSSGMKMKLNIAIALSHNAELLVLDEPTSGLDPFIRNIILNDIYKYVKNENASAIISSHICSDLEKICSRLVLLKDGKILLNDSIKNIYNGEKNESIENIVMKIIGGKEYESYFI